MISVDDFKSIVGYLKHLHREGPSIPCISTSQYSYPRNEHAQNALDEWFDDETVVDEDSESLGLYLVICTDGFKIKIVSRDIWLAADVARDVLGKGWTIQSIEDKNHG